MIEAAADHLGLGDDEIRATLALRPARRRRVYESRSVTIGRQFACAVKGTRLVCPKHGWEFDVVDGRSIKGEAPLRELPNRIDERAVVAYW